MTARLPPDKLHDLLTLIEQWVHKKWCKPKELQSLVGKLNHASSVVVPGRTFLRRLFNLLRDSQHGRRFIRLNSEARLDLKWWSEFLPSWNGVCFFDLPDWAQLPDFQLATDASGSKGFGAYNNGQWFNCAWLPSQRALGIAYKELFPIVLACHIWGPVWGRQRIEFLCDNQSVVHILRSGSSKDDKIMHLIRELFLLTAKFNFRVSATHIPGKTNAIADALSRFNLQEFRRLAPQANQSPVDIPHSVQVRLTCNL